MKVKLCCACLVVPMVVLGQDRSAQSIDASPEPVRSRFEEQVAQLDRTSPAAYTESVRRELGALKRVARDEAEQARLREVVTRYRLLAGEDDPPIAGEGYDVPVVRPDVARVPYLPVVSRRVPTAPIDGVDVVATRVVVLTPEQMRLEVQSVLTASPAIREWRATWDVAFAVMGRHGLYVPKKNTPLGAVSAALQLRIEAAGPGWRSDAELLTDWERYWRLVGAALDRRGGRLLPQRGEP